MAVRTGQDATGRFPYAEIDTTFGGDTYIVRVTALYPYRDLMTDELNAHIDWHNISTGDTGRWANVLLPAKQGAEGRRGPLLREFATRRLTVPFVASPVFP